MLFQVPSPKVPKGVSTISIAGSWLTDSVYAKSGLSEITGYDRKTGTKKWTLDLPGPVCAATSYVTADNKTAIVHKPAMPSKTNPQSCTEVAVVDLAAGTKVWTKTAKSGTMPVSFSNVTIGGGTVAAGSTSGGAAWDLATGDERWAPKTSDSCYDAGYGGGTKLVAVRKCGSYDQRQLHIQNVDPKTGDILAEYKMDEGIEYAAVVSTDPLVVAADVGDSAATAAASPTSSPSTTRPASCAPASPRRATSSRPAATPSTRWRTARGSRSATTGCTSPPRSTTAAATATARPTRSSRSTWPPASRPASGPTPARTTRSSRCAWTAPTSSRTSGRRTTRAGRSSASTASPSRRPS
ncbi:PQQ-binding-like beta-propeller repeat protein [Streptomyces thermocarboxydus]